MSDVIPAVGPDLDLIPVANLADEAVGASATVTHGLETEDLTDGRGSRPRHGLESRQIPQLRQNFPTPVTRV